MVELERCSCCWVHRTRNNHGLFRRAGTSSSGRYRPAGVAATLRSGVHRSSRLALAAPTGSRARLDILAEQADELRQPGRSSRLFRAIRHPVTRNKLKTHHLPPATRV